MRSGFAFYSPVAFYGEGDVKHRLLAHSLGYGSFQCSIVEYTVSAYSRTMGFDKIVSSSSMGNMFDVKNHRGSVLQVNVRLSEGGAAGVARTLQQSLQGLGFESRFAYGFSKRGLSSPDEKNLDAVRLTPRFVAVANHIMFGLKGEETKLRGKTSWSNFSKSIEQSDVVHLHAVHSSMVNFDSLVDLLLKAGKPVVWTMHDRWLFSGRCAIPGQCKKFLTGCGQCPTLNAYPAGLIDHSARVWKEKRANLLRLREALPLEIVACAKWIADEANLAGIAGVKVVNNSVDQLFWERVKTSSAIAAHDGKSKVLFMSRDLRDPLKVDWPFLQILASLPDVDLTIVGDNPPSHIQNATMLPSIRSRHQLAELMLENQVLLFLSTVDAFPLTIVEALAAGLQVLALNSEATLELSRHGNVKLFSHLDEIYSFFQSGSKVLGYSRNESHRIFFSPERMTSDYLKIYESVSKKKH